MKHADILVVKNICLICSSIVSSPDLIRHVYRLQCAILKVICIGVGFGSGTETSMSISWTTVSCSISIYVGDSDTKG